MYKSETPTGCMYTIDGPCGKLKRLSLHCNANAVNGEHSRHKPNSVALRTRRMIRPPAPLCGLPVGAVGWGAPNVSLESEILCYHCIPRKPKTPIVFVMCCTKDLRAGSLTPPFHIPQPHAPWSAMRSIKKVTLLVPYSVPKPSSFPRISWTVQGWVFAYWARPYPVAQQYFVDSPHCLPDIGDIGRHSIRAAGKG